MEIDVRNLPGQAAQVIDAMVSGEQVMLTIDGKPMGEIVKHDPRPRWISGKWLREQLRGRTA
jgi:antitoxin (DNA-binding transcriptional repressor) of toxin-antitoxin stability system